jgi:hypothetical protein
VVTGEATVVEVVEVEVLDVVDVGEVVEVVVVASGGVDMLVAVEGGVVAVPSSVLSLHAASAAATVAAKNPRRVSRVGSCSLM